MKKIINRPTAIRTHGDINWSNGYLDIIFIGQNGGWDDVNDLVNKHKLMIDHSNSKHTIILGLSTGSSAYRADYENAMTTEFGRYFISLREYLSTPIYDTDGETIISSYGLDDAGYTPTQSDLDAITSGTIPPQLTTDGTHYTSETKTVIGNLIYKRCVELGIF